MRTPFLISVVRGMGQIYYDAFSFFFTFPCMALCKFRGITISVVVCIYIGFKFDIS